MAAADGCVAIGRSTGGVAPQRSRQVGGQSQRWNPPGSLPRARRGGDDVKLDHPYIDALRGIQDRLVVDIRTVRSMMHHPGEIGGRVEELIRHALTQLLPEKIGVSKGFVVDSAGAMSKQMDIVLYDRLNAPQVPLPEGAYPKGTRVFPVEATYACGEIKTVLDSARLEQCIAKCDSYKALERQAYLTKDSGPIVETYNLYGEDSLHWQSIFFCLAVESVDMSILVKKLRRDVMERQLLRPRWIDGIFTLDTSDTAKKNCILYAKLRDGVADGEVQGSDVESVRLLAEPDHVMVSYRAHAPLALFIVQLMRYLQASLEQVNIVSYWKGSF